MVEEATMIEPNYEVLFKSAVTALQVDYGKLKAAQIEAIKWTFVDSDGHFYELAGCEERRKQVVEFENRVAEDLKEIYRLRYSTGDSTEEVMRDEMDDAMPTYESNPDDIVRVVRCKDCKEANYAYMCGLVAFWNTPNDYCSRGVRRGESEKSV